MLVKEGIRGVFVTGTDTHVGKTHVALKLMKILQDEGFCVGGMKPVASGGGWVSGQWRNEDALVIESRASVRLPYEWVNPFSFRNPISPQIAARQEGRSVSLDVVMDRLRKIQAEVDCVVIEGAGGWLAPLADGLDVADLAHGLAVPVVLVIGIRLGCINHARMTDRLIRMSGVPYAGWVANCIDPTFAAAKETVDSLIQFLGEEPLGRVGFELDLDGVEPVPNNHWNHGEILRRMFP